MTTRPIPPLGSILIYGTRRVKLVGIFVSGERFYVVMFRDGVIGLFPEELFERGK